MRKDLVVVDSTERPAQWSVSYEGIFVIIEHARQAAAG